MGRLSLSINVSENFWEFEGDFVILRINNIIIILMKIINIIIMILIIIICIITENLYDRLDATLSP